MNTLAPSNLRASTRKLIVTAIAALFVAPLLWGILLSAKVYVVGGTAAERRAVHVRRFRDGALLLGIPTALIVAGGCAFFVQRNRAIARTVRAGRPTLLYVGGVAPISDRFVGVRLPLDPYRVVNAGVPRAAAIRVGQPLPVYFGDAGVNALLLPDGCVYPAYVRPLQAG